MEQRQAPAADPRVWLACAPALSRLPEVGGRVYYLPAGHAAQGDGAPPAQLPDRVPCTVTGIDLLATAFDDVYVKIKLRPRDDKADTKAKRGGVALAAGSEEDLGHNTGDDPAAVPAGDGDDPAAVPAGDGDDYIGIYPKVLTKWDVRKGHGRGAFQAPKKCSESIFPELDATQSYAPQALKMADLAGRLFSFKHALSGKSEGRRQHLLTRGWSEFLGAKVPARGDLVLFIRAGERLVIALQRAAAPAALVRSEDVAEALHLASEGRTFTVLWCPRHGAEFVVPIDEVDAARRYDWAVGAGDLHHEPPHAYRLVHGTVKAVHARSWKMLQIDWDAQADTESTEEDRPTSCTTGTEASAITTASRDIRLFGSTIG